MLDAWGLLGSAFAPLLIVQAFGATVPQRLSIPMVLVGVAVFLLWQIAGLDAQIYSVAPGMVTGFLVWWIGRRTVLNQVAIGRAD